jgi:hypothetical protein
MTTRRGAIALTPPTSSRFAPRRLTVGRTFAERKATLFMFSSSYFAPTFFAPSYWAEGSGGVGFGPTYFTIGVDDAAGDWAEIQVDIE